MHQLNITAPPKSSSILGLNAFPLHKLLHQATESLTWVSPHSPSPFDISNEVSFLSNMAGQLKRHYGTLTPSEQEQIKTYLKKGSRDALVQELMITLFKPDMLMCFRHRERVVAECLYDIILALT